MLAGILRRIRSLEQRALASKVERLPRPPIWWLTKWEQHLGVPVDEYGQPKFAPIKRNQAGHAGQRPQTLSDNAEDFNLGGRGHKSLVKKSGVSIRGR
jgi:hypothetical protein